MVDVYCICVLIGSNGVHDYNVRRLTLIGKDREAQGVVGGSNVDTFGLLIRNHQGPFCIDVHSIKVQVILQYMVYGILDDWMG